MYTFLKQSQSRSIWDYVLIPEVWFPLIWSLSLVYLSFSPKLSTGVLVEVSLVGLFGPVIVWLVYFFIYFGRVAVTGRLGLDFLVFIYTARYRL